MTDPWIAQRTHTFDSSGIRKVFDLAGSMDSPIDLSIGQPDYDVPARVRAACIDAIESGKNNYALTQGVPVLREKLQARIDQQYGHADRGVFVCSGTSGGLVLALLSMVDPGDEVIVFDPYFVMYESLTRLVGGIPVLISTYPDFQIPLDRVAEAITDKTKLILLNSPANPTGAMATPELIQGLAELAAQHNVALISDEIYSEFCYDQPFVSPAEYNERTIVIDGFSKNYAMTGWRLGFVHGPHELIDTMIKVQQYTFVCAPHPVQWAGAAAMDVDVQPHIKAYHKKRDMIVEGLSDLYEIANPNGAFYV
ncbi:MAG: pyridoxal phosphate-dependent aminotransferase, partial [Planctomycetota bacterium]